MALFPGSPKTVIKVIVNKFVSRLPISNRTWNEPCKGTSKLVHMVGAFTQYFKHSVQTNQNFLGLFFLCLPLDNASKHQPQEVISFLKARSSSK